MSNPFKERLEQLLSADTSKLYGTDVPSSMSAKDLADHLFRKKEEKEPVVEAGLTSIDLNNTDAEIDNKPKSAFLAFIRWLF